METKSEFLAIRKKKSVFFQTWLSSKVEFYKISAIRYLRTYHLEVPFDTPLAIFFSPHGMFLIDIKMLMPLSGKTHFILFDASLYAFVLKDLKGLRRAKCIEI